jgi:hypothetical protein
MNLFRELTDGEKEDFRQWARENYKPYDPILGIWHPVVQEECVKMNQAAKLDFGDVLTACEK